jgi:epoxyqueuosine reductase
MITAPQTKALARETGFSLAGVTSAEPLAEAQDYARWLALGYAGEMTYLYGRRAEMRRDVRSLLPSARSAICLGLLYNTPVPYSTQWDLAGRAWISRYAWGDDYHDVMRAKMREFVERLLALERFEWKMCVDTAPVLERALAQRAGLGWIGKNTCLINQQLGSWVFLGEILTSLELEPDAPPPFRCGSCTRCIDACPTQAIVADGVLDSRLCISYWTIELRGDIPEEHRAQLGPHVFGCDICQDVCPWNRRAPTTADPAFAPRETAPLLERLAGLSEAEFAERFRGSPVTRARYQGFLRNVAAVMDAGPAAGRNGTLKVKNHTPVRRRTTMPIAVGQTAPDFTLKDQNQNDVTLSSFRGRNVVLALYPLDWSPVCTKEHACFVDDLTSFNGLNAQVLGLSVDSVWSHKAYADKMKITYPLLADFHPRGAVASKFGLYLDDKGITNRATVIIDKQGVVRHVAVYEILSTRSNQDLMAELKKLG